METSVGSESLNPLEKRSKENCSETIVPSSPSSEFKSQWRREVLEKGVKSGKSVRYIRSQSLSTFGQQLYTANEIRRMRERLLRTHNTPQPGALRNFTRTQKLALTSLCLVDFISFCSMSVMAPFFPKEASQKGMTDTVSGFVFSFYALIMFLSSPVFGKILPRVGAKFLFMSGIFVAGGCNILFGMLAHIESYYMFTSYCFLVRGMEALGASAYATASYVFVVDIFPDNIGSVLGILETFVGLGMSTGPAIGGLLYSVGGFELPFYSLGILMVLIVPVNFCLLPAGDACSVGKSTGSLMKLIKLPSVIIISMVIVVISNTWGFLDPTLEPHLREFDLSPEKVGLIFLLFSALYGVFSPIWGWLADRVNNHWSMMVVGLAVCSVGLLLLGPSPLLPFLSNTVWLNLVALSIMGVSVALTLLPTFQGVLDSALEGGCSDEIGTYSMVAGVWSCMYSLGEVIGPSVGGLLVDYYGFPICSTVMAGFTFALSVAAFLYFSTRDAKPGAPPNETSTDSGISDSVSSWERDQSEGEDSPLLASGNSAIHNGVTSREHGLYTNEKVQYYSRLCREDGAMDGSSEWVDTMRTVAITGGGACEV
ncbi:MFS-type transporter SLC18B1 [Anabrus simplex]|uniref:MFS-type transporter SLC18B1 n=1 Tax=Anabrus simplex TaxID=316456 RepID=UPI0035A27A42